MKIMFVLFAVILLTIVTQIGGLVLLMGLMVSRIFGWYARWKTLLFSLTLYLIISLGVLPQVAPMFGREPVRHTASIKPATWFTVLANRNYVRPAVNKLLVTTAESVQLYGIKIIYLDANFPFINGFPLLPHLSHNDGRKLDVALVYEDKKGTIVPAKKSRTGYGVYVAPKKGETDQVQKCKESGYYQYDYSRFFSFGAVNKELNFSEKGTKVLINSLLKNPEIQKTFIEPHLKSRLKLTDSRIRFHGCRAVRHDDHIHLQIK